MSSKVCVSLVVCMCMFVPAILNTKEELHWAEKDEYEEIVFLVFLFAFGALGYLCRERKRDIENCDTESTPFFGWPILLFLTSQLADLNNYYCILDTTLRTTKTWYNWFWFLP